MRRGSSAFLIAAAVSAGCSDDSTGPDARDLADNRALWNEVGFTDYSFRFQRLCFCGDIEPVDIEVRGGIITAVFYAESGHPVPPDRYNLYETIDGMFDVVLDALQREAAELTVQYDARLGYPLEIDVDYSFNVADEEQRLIASAVAELQ